MLAVLSAIPLNSRQGFVHSPQPTGKVAQLAVHTPSLGTAGACSSEKNGVITVFLKASQYNLQYILKTVCG